MIALFLTERAFRAQQMCRIQAGQPGAAGKKAAQDEQAYTYVYLAYTGISLVYVYIAIYLVYPALCLVYMLLYQVYDWSFSMPCHMEGLFPMPCHMADSRQDRL